MYREYEETEGTSRRSDQQHLGEWMDNEVREDNGRGSAANRGSLEAAEHGRCWKVKLCWHDTDLSTLAMQVFEGSHARSQQGVVLFDFVSRGGDRMPAESSPAPEQHKRRRNMFRCRVCTEETTDVDEGQPADMNAHLFLLVETGLGNRKMQRRFGLLLSFCQPPSLRH